MALSSNQLIQINATVIAGILVLLGISAQQSRDIMVSGEDSQYLLEFSVLTQIIVKTLMIPFAISAFVEVVRSNKNKEHNSPASKLAIGFLAAGFVLLLLFFLGDVAGGLLMLFS